MQLGLGTGSTVTYFLDALAARELDVAGVPTSEATATRCRELGIRLLDVTDVAALDLVVDGADELDPELNLTKGGGGALLREKVVASMGRRFVVIATEDKRVARLGDTFAIPLEVVPFAVPSVHRTLEARGYAVTERRNGAEPYRTDNGLVILDARRDGGIEDPAVEDVALAILPGVAETGLFIDLADLALLGREDGTVGRVARADRQDGALAEQGGDPA